MEGGRDGAIELNHARQLWNVFAAEETFPPYRRVGECEVKDSKGRSVSLHADTPAILTSLKEKVRAACADFIFLPGHGPCRDVESPSRL